MKRVITLVFTLLMTSLFAEVGDPQIKTDHPWYPGELAISSFERLAATQAEVDRRETGRTRIRFDANARLLKNASVTMRTVCQMNAAVIPQLRSGQNRITYAASGRALYSAGPNRDQAAAHLVDGKIWSNDGATLELATPRGEPITDVYAASHNQSGNPPSPDIAYAIEHSTDVGANWSPIVKDWKIERRAPEPPDLWSALRKCPVDQTRFKFASVTPAEKLTGGSKPT